MKDRDSDARVIFYEALERGTPEEVGAYLDEACGQHGELRERVANLLRAHRDAGNFLGGIPSVEGTMKQLPIADRPGTVLANSNCCGTSAKGVWTWCCWPSRIGRIVRTWCGRQ